MVMDANWTYKNTTTTICRYEHDNPHFPRPKWKFKVVR